MSTQREIRPVDRVPAEPGMWITPLNLALPPLGDGELPPLNAYMVVAAYETAKMLHRMKKAST
ncbi:hypothetical protein [Pseudomonas mediterranea]|uniref:hypothetical protein n=1 Tax=Pseudomonas mediterranea TaxID=183795 RepID=UPI0006D8C36C|nr:hypothetical protein [Pseudomonas mediterranea]